MRKVQVAINIDLFGQGGSGGDDGHSTIHVYADANDIYEALAAAYAEVLEAMQEDRRLPQTGDRTHSWTEG